MAPFYGWGSTASKLEPVFDYAGRWVMIFFQFSPGRFLRTRLFFWPYLVNSLRSCPIVFCFWDYTFIFQLVLRFSFLFYFIIPQCLLNIKGALGDCNFFLFVYSCLYVWYSYKKYPSCQIRISILLFKYNSISLELSN